MDAEKLNQALYDKMAAEQERFKHGLLGMTTEEALNHAFDEPKQWEIREINEIMNQCVTGWKYFSNPRMFAGYGRQKGWEREQKAKADACALTTDTGNGAGKTPEGFMPVPEQMELPF